MSGIDSGERMLINEGLNGDVGSGIVSSGCVHGEAEYGMTLEIADALNLAALNTRRTLVGYNPVNQVHKCIHFLGRSLAIKR